MKRFISISLLVIYVVSTTELCELSKLPLLFRHYQEHKLWDNKITFIEFIAEHYYESIADNADYDLDKKLPFKSHVDHTAVTFWVAPHSGAIFYSFSLKPIRFVEKQSFAFQHDPFVSAYLSKFWQPPKNS